MMKHLFRSWGRSTFVVLMVVALSNAAMAQFSGNNGDSDQYPKGINKLIAIDPNGRLVMGTTAKANSQDNLYEALKSQDVATTMTGAQLTSDWHIISSGELGIFAMLGAGRMMPQIAGFTQGEMVPFGNDKYIVAYYVQDQSDVQDVYSRDPRQTQKGYLFKDSVLYPALLPLDGNQSFYEIKKVDSEKDYLSKPLVRHKESISNLKQIALATFLYVQDYDKTLPPMVASRSADEIKVPFKGKVTNSTSVQNRRMPYLKSKKVFLQPVTHRPYLPNYKVSRLLASKVESRATTILFYEDKPSADGIPLSHFGIGFDQVAR